MAQQPAKRVPKTPIKFQISLNEEQKEAKSRILKSKIAFITGQAGSGKSLLAVQVALDLLFTRQVEKIYIARPAVDAGESYGFMPGTIEEKMMPHIQSLYEHMYDMYSREKIDGAIKEKKIVIAPIGLIRGRNFKDAAVVVDEAQNISYKQMELLLTRLCTGSRMMFVGDTHQIDLKDGSSGFEYIASKLSVLEEVCKIDLKTNHRDPVVKEILALLHEKNEES